MSLFYGKCFECPSVFSNWNTAAAAVYGSQETKTSQIFIFLPLRGDLETDRNWQACANAVMNPPGLCVSLKTIESNI